MKKHLPKPLLYARYLALGLAAILLGGIVFANTPPLGASVQYVMDGKAITQLGPSKRVEIQGDKMIQIANLSYFVNQMPVAFESAKIKLRLKNTQRSQTIGVGYKDQSVWHYNTQIISAPFIDELNWSRVGEGPYLYQKQPTYTSTKQFLDKVPRDKLIGIYDYDKSLLSQDSLVLPDYQPSKTDTVITTPLRGKTTMYVYAQGEPFKMNIQKKDLNWYDDPDVTDITIYKGVRKVFTATIGDDGNTSSDHRVGPPQEATLQNPGPDLPETGVYKVVIDAPGDSVITRISTNLHKITFEGPLYPADNREVYGDITPKTQPTILYTNARNITAEAFHQAAQTILVGTNPIPITSSQLPVTHDPGAGNTTVALPKSDVILNGVGYFAMTSDQFFEPTPYHLMRLTGAEDITKVDYVLTNYSPPKKLEDGWIEVERDFDLRNAIVQKGKLSWLISAPGLAENKNTFEIKDIEMTLRKEGWSKE